MNGCTPIVSKRRRDLGASERCGSPLPSSTAAQFDEPIAAWTPNSKRLPNLRTVSKLHDREVPG